MTVFGLTENTFVRFFFIARSAVVDNADRERHLLMGITFLQSRINNVYNIVSTMGSGRNR